jgi:hypothetical protein
LQFATTVATILSGALAPAAEARFAELAEITVNTQQINGNKRPSAGISIGFMSNIAKFSIALSQSVESAKGPKTKQLALGRSVIAEE